jgi:hypothetical protein
MYGSAYDKNSGCFVVFLGKSEFSTAEQTHLLDQLKQLNEDGLGRSDGVISIIVIESGAPKPDSLWRKRVAEMINTQWPHQRFFAIVSDSMIARSVMTVISWLSPNPINYESSIHTTFDEAMRWAESKRNMKLPILEELQKQAKFSGLMPHLATRK